MGIIKGSRIDMDTKLDIVRYPTNRRPKIQVFQSTEDGKWYWHIKSSNGSILAQSDRGRKRESHAVESAFTMKGAVESAFVETPFVVKADSTAWDSRFRPLSD